MKNLSLFNGIIFIVSLLLFIGVIIKFFILREVSFENFIIGFLLSGTLVVTYIFIFLYGLSSRSDIVKHSSSTKGDIVLNFWAVIFGLICLFKFLSGSNEFIYGITGLLFLLGGILSLFFRRKA